MKKLKYFLFALIPLLITAIVFTFEMGVIPIILLFILVVDFGILIIFFTKKYYNVFFILLGLIMLGMFFKRNHLPGAGVMMTLGTLVSAVCFFILGIKSLSQFKKNKFLRWFGFFINMVFFIAFAGFGFKMQHWPGSSLLITIGLPLFILSILIFVFTLPGSRYHEWDKLSKRFFYRVIILPMIWLFLINAIINAYPDTWNKMMSWDYSAKVHWHMFDYELDEKEGLE